MTEIPADHDSAPEGPDGRQTKLVDVRESIRYRRRAQQAEERCQALEAELDTLRQGHSGESEQTRAALADERTRREALEQQLVTLDAERRLERELIRAGARDPETAMLVARQRLAARGDPADVDAEGLAREVLEEKPYLRTAVRDEVPPLGRSARGAQAPAAGRRHRAEKLATVARASGRRADIVEYMRARRQG